MCRIYSKKKPFIRLCYRTRRRGQRLYPPKGEGRPWLEQQLEPKGHVRISQLPAGARIVP